MKLNQGWAGGDMREKVDTGYRKGDKSDVIAKLDSFLLRSLTCLFI